MSKRKICIGVLLLSILSVCIVNSQNEPKQKITGPYRHENLEIFLIQDDSVKGTSRKYLPLEKAIEKEIVTVHETGNVSKLSIENTSEDVYVFVNSGDIVKGGKQDRVIRYDMILIPKSGKIPLASFCVESGRWCKRSGEKVGKFSSSKQMISSKALKIAAKHIENQGEVWNKVSTQQKKLNNSLRKKTGKRNLNVRSSQSSSSMQLTLENKDLKKQVKEYQATLSKILDGKKNIVGFAFAINGEMNNADIYCDPDLFRALWPKLLKSAIVEALSEYGQKKKQTTPLKTDDVVKMLEGSKKHKKESVKEVNKNTYIRSNENADYLMFETNENEKKQWIHRNYIKKGPEQKNAPKRINRRNDNRYQQIQIRN